MNPPKLSLRFLRWFCREDFIDEIEGDLTELFRKNAELSPLRAKWQFAWQVLKYFRPEYLKSLKNSQPSEPLSMYKNYLTVALRVFNREKLYSLINISGLALGFTCCLLIYLFIRDERNYDRYHAQGDRTYRVAAAYMRQGVWEPYSTNAWRTGELIRTSFPEVEQLTMFLTDNNIFVYKDKRIPEERIIWANDNFFDVFTFPFVKGNPAEALKGTNKVVITESIARKYFGDEDPMGKTIDGSDGALHLQVSGVISDMPSNSHFHFDFLISGETLKAFVPEELFTNVGWDSQYVYVRLAEGTDPASVDAAFPAFIDKHLDFLKTTNFKLFLQPLYSIHLESNLGTEIEANGKLSQVYTFSVIAIFILAIGCVNYVNLTTARSLRRAKEVSMRKVMGGKRGDLMKQFLTETFLITCIAIVLALVAAWLILPEFNRFAGKDLPKSILFSKEILTTLAASVIVIGLVAGLYPSLVLSSFKSASSMKGIDLSGKFGFLFRRGLVVLQFVISIGLITASAIVFQQWEFMKNKSLGINQDMLLAIPMQTMQRTQLGAFKDALYTSPAIQKIGSSNMRMPGWIFHSTSYRAQDVEVEEGKEKSMKLIRADYDFMDAIGVEFVAGRNFSRDFPDSISIILNETAVEQLGWKDPIGRWMQVGRTRFTVVGVVRDFHFESLHRKIAPIIFLMSTQQLNWIYARIDGEHAPEAITHISNTYSRFVTNRDFTYTFVDQDIENQYKAEERFTQVFTLFTALAIAIACLGTFGLISFAAERKSKEIGIRKVLGASIGNVSFLLVREFIFLLLIASVIGLPLTWYFTDDWLSTFVYRSPTGPGPFLLGSLLAGIIVVATTGFRAVKAALANPVDSLREE